MDHKDHGIDGDSGRLTALVDHEFVALAACDLRVAVAVFGAKQALSAVPQGGLGDG